MKGIPMSTSCSAYATDVDAHAAVERLIEDGTPGTRITVLTGRLEHDSRDDRPGSFAGVTAGVGAFAGASGSTADAMGAFADGAGDTRRGGFGDSDRDVVTTYRDGVKRMHVASHRELQHVLAGAGLDEEAIAADVAAVHHGRVLVLVTAA
jgi:hypothetical protein